MGYAPAIAMVFTSLLQYRQTRVAGQISAIEAETAARQEELAATQREADRKETLARALASQNAAFAASNIASYEGSPLSILEADIQKEREATQRDTVMSQLGGMITRSQGQIQKKYANTSATIGLMSDVSRAAQLYTYGGN